MKKLLLIISIFSFIFTAGHYHFTSEVQADPIEINDEDLPNQH